MGLQFLSEFRDCHQRVALLLDGDLPFFIARIGGSDTDLIMKYYAAVSEGGHSEATHAVLSDAWRIKRFNGYYDKRNCEEKILQFCTLMTQGYLASTDLAFCGSSWLSAFFPECINERFRIDTSGTIPMQTRLLHHTTAAQRSSLICYPYSFMERTLAGHWTLFRCFANTLAGKTVLAITPFERSILANFDRRRDFFRNYQYPEFRLVTYNTPITYDGLPDEYYPHMDWFETLEAMQTDVSNLDFDVALLSCGSYAIPLGSYIRDQLGRKAIYVGGVLQLFFGIMGRRYQNEFFTSQINAEAFIHPLESEDYLKFYTIRPETAAEAFGAYF